MLTNVLNEHAERADAALRRLRQALAPMEDQILEAASQRGPAACVSVHVSLWEKLHTAIFESEPWPMELLGPVEFVTADPDLKPVKVQAWFTRGWHDLYRFSIFATSKTRHLVGGALVVRECPLGAEMHHAWWAPPDLASGRVHWGPIPADDARRVPVTVWVDPARRGA